MIGDRLRLLVAALVLSCLGCGWLVKPAEVELVGLAFPGESVVDLTVKIVNPNSFAVQASDLEYTVRINDETVGRGRRAEALGLEAGSSVVARLPLSYDLPALLRVLPGVAQDTIVCRVDGTYRLKALFAKPKLSFVSEYRVAARDRLRELLGEALP